MNLSVLAVVPMLFGVLGCSTCVSEPENPIDVLFLGDSLSDFDRGSNHVDRLQQKLDAAWPGKVKIHNFAIRGDFIDRMNDRLDGKKGTYALDRYKGMWDRPYAWAFVSLGHNDTRAWSTDDFATPELSPEHVREGYAKLIAFLKTKGIGRIVLYSAASSNFELTRPRALAQAAKIKAGKTKAKRAVCYGNPKHLEAFNAVMKSFADADPAVDYFDLYTGMKGLSEKGTYFNPNDGVHLSRKGHIYVAAREFSYLTTGK